MEYAVKARVARKKSGSALDGRTARSKGHGLSLRCRKQIEEAFGWGKRIGRLQQLRHSGLAKVSGQVLLCFVACNLTPLTRRTQPA